MKHRLPPRPAAGRTRRAHKLLTTAGWLIGTTLLIAWIFMIVLGGVATVAGYANHPPGYGPCLVATIAAQIIVASTAVIVKRLTQRRAAP